MSQLTVPKEFIDYPIDEFKEDLWAEQILSSCDEPPKAQFNYEKYSSRRMVEQILEMTMCETDRTKTL